ncbi:putative Microtubule binding stalk of dynein motor [Trypanosoma vivax]|uniref:Dynein heavy chain, cytosolic, putative n=1 Tax=Trypanosoma vivax (strain Y486) TaxID=1055687 RepID=F9WMB9_TRYVY|nr:putative dynein heavy chain, cytosolic [Trypanosoma vivax]KAH8611000.1 putative Microtubule binding stalk of dynein motor [Trypanosoma vivax]CCD18672.1 dynein heavy chain, cytosolic, putative [Trypanosoma vivax Y486]|eukprot:CCD18672.1 dynein heavy chain, cytosolic, putative [Trypanosoma vivax Y486]
MKRSAATAAKGPITPRPRLLSLPLPKLVPPPSSLERKVVSTFRSPRASIALSGDSDVRARRGDCRAGFVPLSVNDIVAYEYVDGSRRWRWGLAAVAAIPAPRLVQLMLWRCDSQLFSSHGSTDSGADMPEGATHSENGSRAEKKRKREALRRLEQLSKQRALVHAELDAITKRLTAHELSYAVQRRRAEDDAAVAEHNLMEVRSRVHSIQLRDWREIRCYPNPPAIVRLVIEAVLTVLGERGCSHWAWQQMQSVMRSSDFVRLVEHFDPQKLSDEVKHLVRKKFIDDPRFTYEDAMKGSQALGYLHRWVVAQVDTAAAKDTLALYDDSHRKEKTVMVELRKQIDAFNHALQKYADEEDRLHAVLRDAASASPHRADAAASDCSPGGAHVSSGAREMGDGDIADKSRNMTPRASNEQSKRVSHPDESQRHVQNNVRGLWTCTGELVVTLRSSILCNFGVTENSVIHLTPEQLHAVEDALRGCNNGGWDNEKRVEEREQALQDALLDLRGQHGEALGCIGKLESRNHDLERELERREEELHRLNRMLYEKGGSRFTAKMEDCGAQGAQWQEGERADAMGLDGHVIGGPHRAFSGDGVYIIPSEGRESNINEVICPTTIRALEEKLARALRDNPTEAHVQLLEDDVCALQDELSYNKEELHRFRSILASLQQQEHSSVQVPGLAFSSKHFYTSSAVRVDQESAALLAALRGRVSELEAALQGVSTDSNAVERVDGNKNELQLERLRDELANERDMLLRSVDVLRSELSIQKTHAHAIEERFQSELNAHEKTQQLLRSSEEKLKSFLSYHTGASVVGSDAGTGTKDEQLWGMGRDCKTQLTHLHSIAKRLVWEAERQEDAARSTESVLVRVRQLVTDVAGM